MAHLSKFFATLALLTASVFSAFAGTSGSADGIVLPPSATPNGIVLVPFGTDPTPFDTITTSLTSPLGGTLDFSSTGMTHQKIGSGWATWSNGYTGSVYTDYQSLSLTLTLPAATTAFAFYIEPNAFDLFNVTASSGLVSVSQTINGLSGASLFTFWTDGTTFLDPIDISVADGSRGFAIGQFYIGNDLPSAGPTPVPEPSTYGLIGASLLAGLGVLRRRKRQG